MEKVIYLFCSVTAILRKCIEGVNPISHGIQIFNWKLIEKFRENAVQPTVPLKRGVEFYMSYGHLS